MRELARETGLTVLFVSHDMEAVSRICDRVIWIKDGALHRAGEPEDVVTEYQNARTPKCGAKPIISWIGPPARPKRTSMPSRWMA